MASGSHCGFTTTTLNANIPFVHILLPGLGGKADQWDRMIIIIIGTSMQAMGCLASVMALLLWTWLSKNEDDKNSDDSSTIKSAWYQPISLSIVIVAGVVETLGAQLASVAVKKEWVPIVFAEESCDASYTTTNKSSNNPPNVKLSFINTTITNIDLLAAMFGPILTGWILQVLGGGHGTYSVQRGFIAIALMNASSFIPEIILLRQVYNSCPALQRRRGAGESIMNAELLTKLEPTANPWTIWYHHPSGLPLLTLSLSSLYLTALSPAGVVLTAYLVTMGLSPTAIGTFRACGAISGVLGIWLFSMMRNNSGEAQIAGAQDMNVKSIDRLRRVSLASLLLEVVSVFLAGATFSMIRVVETDGPLSLPIIVFLGFIVLSRAGLYSFDLGVLEIEQYVVDERYRNAVGSVEGALCSIAEMGIYVMSIFMSDPTDFGWQVLVSIIAVSFGGLCFTTFLCMYHLHRHHHDDFEHHHDHTGECAHHHHMHTHTWQQEQDLKKYGYHTHLHRHLRSQKSTL